MLNRSSELGKHMAKLANKLSGTEEELTSKKRFGIF